jgi:toxin YoeB
MVRRKINRLIQDIERNGYRSIGKPEPLKEVLAGWWSVKIDEKNRIVFKISVEGDGKILEISQCGSHYSDK